MLRAAIIGALMLAGAGCGSSTSSRENGVAVAGRTFEPANLTPEKRAELEGNLAQARAAYEAEPGNEDNIVWLGRRLAYLGRYGEAIDVFTKGIGAHPDSVKLLRHRGHRYITTRRFDLAAKDLQRAANLIRDKRLA